MDDYWYPLEISDSNDYVDPASWGKDHWSTLAYLETVCVDQRGQIQNPQMRCNPRLHRTFAHSADGSQYPTRLKDGELPNHDDWSCLEDAVAFGLLKAEWQTYPESPIFGGSKARVELTPLGSLVTAELRRHKAAGGSFADFMPSPELLTEMQYTHPLTTAR